MAMSSLSAAPSSHTLFDARAHRLRRRTNLRLIDCQSDFPAARVEDHQAAFVQKARIDAPFATVEITPANSVKRRASIEGLPSSTLRDVTRKFSFVPAGHEYYDWHDPRTPARMAFFYFGPEALPLAAIRGETEQVLSPRLFFEDLPPRRSSWR